jgi:UDP-N-acetylmuramoyl-tripeptide--D-alanyl-D-alanine ligase
MNGAEPVARPAMMDLNELARAVGGELAGAAVEFSGVTTDSRASDAGDLFVALKGERFDGHDYVAQAIARGAAAALTSRRVEAKLPVAQVVVADTRLALGRLAGAWRASPLPAGWSRSPAATARRR